MKNLMKLSSFILMFFFTFSQSQEVVTKDTISGTSLTISMPQKVSDIISKMQDNCSISTTKKSSSWNATSYEEENKTTSTPKKVVVPSRKLTNAEICAQNPRILGYKILLTVVKSNKEANEVKAYFRRRFPSIKAETDASLRPNYKILVGSYFTKESASSDLRKIREYFNSAVVVRYRIFCADAK